MLVLASCSPRRGDLQPPRFLHRSILTDPALEGQHPPMAQQPLSLPATPSDSSGTAACRAESPNPAGVEGGCSEANSPGTCGITPVFHHTEGSARSRSLLRTSQRAASEHSPVEDNALYGPFLQSVILFPDTASYHSQSRCSQTARTGLTESGFSANF